MDPLENPHSGDNEKVLSIQTLWPGNFRVIDSRGRKLAEHCVRPQMEGYLCAHVPGEEKGSILGGFGRDVDTPENAMKMVRDFFTKHGFSFQE